MPTVANVRGITPAQAAARGIIYCGRACHGFPRSPLGNHGRIHTADAYLESLYLAIESRETEVIQAMAQIQPDSVLGCWCHPAPCHCDLLAQVWEKSIPFSVCDHCGREVEMTWEQYARSTATCPHCRKQFTLD